MTRAGALTNSQIFRAALVVLLGFLASGVLGIVRIAIISATFGASAELDAFYAAQRIPEMLFVLVAGGALGSSFIPVFTRFLSAEDQLSAWRLASAVMTLAAAAAGVLALLIALFAPWLVPAMLVPGASPVEQDLTVKLVQVMLLTPMIFAVSGLLMGILNAHQNFIFPALALSMNNIGIIIGALVFAPLMARAPNIVTYIDPLEAGTPLGLVNNTSQDNVYGLALGAVLGAVLHLCIQLPGLRALGPRLRLLFDWRIAGVREVLVLMGPRVLGLAVVQINFVVNIAFASAMVNGSQTALTTAWTLMFFVLGVLAQSAGTAVFPTLSRLAADGDMVAYRDRLAGVMRAALFMAFPATVGLIIVGEPLIGTLFERGQWLPVDTQATAWALAFFALGIAGHSLLEILSRAFYALSDTWTPVKAGIGAMVSNIVLSVIFIQFIGDPDSLARGPFAGLALANSITTLVEAALLWWLLSRRIGGVNDRYVLRGAGKALVAALLMGVAVWWVDAVLMSERIQAVRLLGAAGTGILVFFVLALVLRLDEVTVVLRRLRIARN
jgi:putative peptidoglycan lipid II flippase